MPASATELTIEAHDRLDRLRASNDPAVRAEGRGLAENVLRAAVPGSRSFEPKSRERVTAGALPRDAPWKRRQQVLDADWRTKSAFFGWLIGSFFTLWLLISIYGWVTAGPSRPPETPAVARERTRASDALANELAAQEKERGRSVTGTLLMFGAVLLLLGFWFVTGAAVYAGLLWLLGWTVRAAVRPFFAGRGPPRREEESAGGIFAASAGAAAPLAAAAVWVCSKFFEIPGQSAATAAAAAVGGLAAGGYHAALEFDMHARRRELLREVIRRADRLLGGVAGGTSSRDAADPPDAALPPHVAALARLLGHLAKCDGRIVPSEVEAAEKVVRGLGLDAAGREAFVRAFGAGKQTEGLADDLAAVRGHCGDDRELVREAAAYLLVVAQADGHVGVEEAAVLDRANREAFGGTLPFAALIESHNADSPYAFGLTPPCTREEAKRAHRKKAAELHPDRLRHQNIPDEMRAFAEARYRAVNDAYERIRGDLG